MTIFSGYLKVGMAPLAPLATPIHEGNYTVLKLPRNGNCKTKKINKKQFSFWKLIEWKYLMIFTQIIHW